MSEFITEMDDSDSNYDEYDEDPAPIKCLFCDDCFLSMESAVTHCKDIHQFDFQLFGSKFQMDCYSFIKFINFFRSKRIPCEEILNTEIPIWNDDSYLKPTIENDPWLMFDFEEYFSSSTDQRIDDRILSYEDRIQDLQRQLHYKDEQITDLCNQMAQMKEFVKRLYDEETDFENGKMKNISLGSSAYFESYSHPGIHFDMLSDKVRTDSYRDAILKNESIFKGKCVMDLGCGTGILSLFAVAAGAEKVLAVDNSDIAYFTMDIVRENKMDDKIQILKSQIEDLKLPAKGVDVIISEWMGYFLLYEGMLDSLIYARDMFLSSEGILMPNKCDLMMCGACDPEGRDSSIDFWSNIYGYKMSCIMKETRQQAVVDVIPESKIVTNCVLLSCFNLYTCTVADTEFSSSFELFATQNSTITTLVGYFDTTFNLQNEVSFSTSPFSQTTHWKQTLFHLYEPVVLKKGNSLRGSIICKRNENNKRTLLITIVIDDKKYIYNLN